MPSVVAAPCERQRGSGSLPVVLFLLVGASLGWLYANRSLLIEVRSTAATLRASVAREAAEGGIGWALAQLHATAPVGPGCRPGAGAVAPFVDSILPVDVTDPARRRHPGPMQPACVLHPAGWQCACPPDGAGTPPAPAASDAAAPAFRLQVEAGPDERHVWLHSRGCSEAPCPSTDMLHRAQRHLRVLLGQLAALPRPPSATVTALGDVQLSGGAQVVNTTPEHAWTIATAGTVSPDPSVRLIGLPGQPDSTTVRRLEPGQLGTGGTVPSAETWFSRHFAFQPSAYRDLPHVHVLPCGGSCTVADVQNAFGTGYRVLWVEGDLLLDTAILLGALEDPVLLIVTGALNITGEATLHGVVHAGRIVWESASQGSLRGALNSAGSVRLAGPLRLVREETAIARLAHAHGTWTPAMGGRRDLDD